MASDITFGVELEFAIPDSTLPADQPRPRDGDDAHRLAASHVASTGVARLCRGAPEASHHVNLFTVLRGPPGANPAALTTADCYFVHCDSVIPPGRDDWYGLEIATAARSLTTIRDENSELAGFLKHMRNSQMGLAVTDLCGVHVHVGHKGEGITLETAKRMVTFVALLEKPLLMELVSPDRMESKFFSPIMEYSMLTRRIMETRAQAGNLNGILPPGYDSCEFWEANGRTLGPFISEIWRCQTLQDISDALLQETDDKCSLNLTLRYPDDVDQDLLQPDPRKCTFEFRYPQGSFCKDFIRMWVMITSCILAICREGNEASYRRTLGSVFQVLEQAEQVKQERCVPGLLRALGLGGHVQEWGQLMREIGDGHDRSLAGQGEFRRLVPE